MEKNNVKENLISKLNIIEEYEDVEKSIKMLEKFNNFYMRIDSMVDEDKEIYYSNTVEIQFNETEDDDFLKIKNSIIDFLKKKKDIYEKELDI